MSIQEKQLPPWRPSYTTAQKFRFTWYEVDPETKKPTKTTRIIRFVIMVYTRVFFLSLSLSFLLLCDDNDVVWFLFVYLFIFSFIDFVTIYLFSWRRCNIFHRHRVHAGLLLVDVFDALFYRD